MAFSHGGGCDLGPSLSLTLRDGQSRIAGLLGVSSPSGCGSLPQARRTRSASFCMSSSVRGLMSSGHGSVVLHPTSWELQLMSRYPAYDGEAAGLPVCAGAVR